MYLLHVDMFKFQILEIGVYRGIRSFEMISLASDLNSSIRYYGFDLFEKISKKLI